MSEELSIRKHDETVLVTISGRAGVDLANDLYKKLLSINQGSAIAIEWDQAEHIETCVFQVLIAFANFPGSSGVRVQRDNDRIRGYLTLAGLSEYFPVTNGNPSPIPSEVQ